jgi:hypothetical protein
VYADLFDDDLDAVAVALDEAAMKSAVARMLPPDQMRHSQRAHAKSPLP